jgi:hypothetical protein
VDDDGELTVPTQFCGDYQFHQRIATYGNFVWASHPWESGDPPLISSQENARFLNPEDGSSRYAFIAIGSSISGTTWSDFTFGIALAREDNKVDYRYSVEFRIRLSFRWTTANVGNLGWRASTGKFTGGKSITAPVALPDDLVDRLSVLVEGLTYFSHSRLGMRYLYDNEPVSHALDIILEFLDTLPLSGYMSKWSKWSRQRITNWSELVMSTLVPSSERFLLHEDLLIQDGLDPLLLPNDALNRYWRNVLIQQAYLDTLTSVPRLNDNSISNVIEIAGFIKSLLIDHKIELPKSLGDVWLSYRYSYATSKLDAEEAISFVSRYRDLGTLDQWLHCYGASSHHFIGERFEADIVCRCKLEIRPKDIALLGRVWRALYTYGLQPNFYVVWDMIPYSFIVDWLIPIGKLAQVLDASNIYNGTYYEIKGVNFSFSYDIIDDSSNRYHQYSRYVSNGVPQLNGFYFFEEDPTSSKVKGMRALDALSLFIGKG